MALKALQNAFCLIEDHMYCSGVVPLEDNCASLFYRSKDGSPDLINFLDANDSQLAALSSACEPASFGRDHEDVLDEEYRKAGKLDSSDFSAQFSIYTSGILDTVISSLLKGSHQANDVRAELYKLNVYGPGSFFKPHVDTPRSDAMFGSLVLVFPTMHEGGSLRFRQGDQQWSFDSSDLVTSEPRVAFAAFFSDVEHEVLPVTSGYRVTITYNLYWAAKRDDTTTPLVVDHPFKDQAKALLVSTLANPGYMPNGGLMGFGLTHMYPIDPKSTNLSEIRLKGSDAVIKQICEDLCLNTSLRALYRGRVRSLWSERNSKPVERRVLMENFAKLGPGQVEIEGSDGGYVGYLYKWESAVKVLDTVKALEDHYNSDSDDERLVKKFNRRVARVDWAKPLPKVNTFQSTFIAYGNEAQAATAYGEVCLVAEVAPAEERLGQFKELQEKVDVPGAGSCVSNGSSSAMTTSAPKGTTAEPTSAEPVLQPTGASGEGKQASNSTHTPGSPIIEDISSIPTTSAPTETAAEVTPAEPATQPHASGKKRKQSAPSTQPTRMSLRTRKTPQ